MRQLNCANLGAKGKRESRGGERKGNPFRENHRADVFTGFSPSPPPAISFAEDEIATNQLRTVSRGRGRESRGEGEGEAEVRAGR
jgi:hypothetical protein